MPTPPTEWFQHTRLARYLPIIGKPLVISHPGGYCLASVWLPIGQQTPRIETRLSKDYATPDEVLWYWASLEACLKMNTRIWPIILTDCLNAPPLMQFLPLPNTPDT